MHINLKYGIVGGLRTRREFSKKKRYYQYADNVEETRVGDV